MNLAMLSLELAVIGLALAVLLIDLWTPREFKHRLGYLAAAGLLVILAASFFCRPSRARRRRPVSAACSSRTAWPCSSNGFFWRPAFLSC
jgi:NADH:ubiquinone oxidoreductase subunit 2 (subunit N)